MSGLRCYSNATGWVAFFGLTSPCDWTREWDDLPKKSIKGMKLGCLGPRELMCVGTPGRSNFAPSANRLSTMLPILLKAGHPSASKLERGLRVLRSLLLYGGTERRSVLPEQ